MSDILYRDPEHKPFILGNGSSRALLIHGFLGSPREMRPLAQALADAGVTAHGLLLPGFGEDIERLEQVKAKDWLTAARDSWAGLRQGAARTTVIGFSMGGAVALRLAAELGGELDQLILLAPHWKFADRRATILPVAKYLIREFRPFGRIDFDSPEMRRVFAEWDPDADLDDPEVRRLVRDSAAIPTHALDELRKIGNSAARAVPRITAPTTILQGTNDPTSLPAYSRKLAARMGADLREFPGDHLILDPRTSCWPIVRDTVVALATGARSKSEPETPEFPVPTKAIPLSRLDGRGG